MKACVLVLPRIIELTRLLVFSFLVSYAQWVNFFVRDFHSMEYSSVKHFACYAFMCVYTDFFVHMLCFWFIKTQIARVHVYMWLTTVSSDISGDR